MNEEIAVGVRCRQVAVVDLLPRELHRAVTARGLGRPRRFGQRTPAAFEGHRLNGVAQIELRLLVREDDSPTAANRFVGADLLGMAVRVDQRVNASGARRAPDGRKQRIGIGGETAVDHQHALETSRCEHVAAGTLQQEHAAQIGGGDARRGLLSAGRSRDQRPAEHGGARLQEEAS